MHQNKKIIICKFNLKNKCKFGEKCKFRHLKVNELNEILHEYEDLKWEVMSLKSQLKEKCLQLNDLTKKNCDVTNNHIYALEKPQYSSFFKHTKCTNSNSTNEKTRNVYSKRKLTRNNIGEDDSVMVEIEEQLKYFKEELEKQKKFNDEIAKNLSEQSTELEQIGKLGDYIMNDLKNEIANNFEKTLIAGGYISGSKNDKPGNNLPSNNSSQKTQSSTINKKLLLDER